MSDITGLLATWRERRRYRRELARIARPGTHLVEDIGFTHRQIEVEIANPFWQVQGAIPCTRRYWPEGTNPQPMRARFA